MLPILMISLCFKRVVGDVDPYKEKTYTLSYVLKIRYKYIGMCYGDILKSFFSLSLLGFVGVDVLDDPLYVRNQ